ncbi:MAG: ATP-binding protein [Rhodothermales bacterium]|nr:ATP-binding protein [Rhodothermales bacterium]
METDAGRISVIDPNGHLIADTKLYFNTNEVSGDFKQYFPLVTSISESDSFHELLRKIENEKQGYGMYVENDETYHVVFKRLKTFDWILAYTVPESTMMTSGDFSVKDLQVSTLTAAVAVMVVTIFTVFLVSGRITNPIVELRDATRKVAGGNLDTELKIKGDDEIRDLVESFESMAQSLKKTIELEKRLAVSEQMLKETKLAAMGSVSARLAHDMRNLLSTIKTTVDLIKGRMQTTDRRVAEQYKRLDRAVEKMTFQVNSMMDFVRTNPLHIEEHSIDDIVEESLGEVEVPEGVTVRRMPTDAKVRCDGRSLEAVMTNLISNAIEAVGSEGEIVVRAWESAEGCIIEVQDSGPGVPEDVLPRIFEPLFTTKTKGTGLGLVSCKSIVEQHGGSVEVFNNPTRFVINLPANVE